MLKALRTKGLVLRHWRMIGNKMNFVVDPSTVTLWKLINLKLYEEDKLAIIKNICEIATKEYGVQTALEALEREIKGTAFSLYPVKDGEAVIVLKIHELIYAFDEFQMRASILKTNPFVKNFYEKMNELEKIVKIVLEILNEWQVF